MTDELQRQMREIERLVQEIESSADPHLRFRAVELMTLLMDVHGAGLRRMMEIVARSSSAGPAVIAALADDPLAASLLLLYGLHPRDLESRVLQALDKARPSLRGHGGDVELVSCEAGVVRLRLTGNCHGCPSSTLTLRRAVEEAMFEFAPDVLELCLDGAVPVEKPASGIAPLVQLT